MQVYKPSIGSCACAHSKHEGYDFKFMRECNEQILLPQLANQIICDVKPLFSRISSLKRPRNRPQSPTVVPTTSPKKIYMKPSIRRNLHESCRLIKAMQLAIESVMMKTLLRFASVQSSEEMKTQARQFKSCF